jgi:hypothetical protein
LRFSNQSKSVQSYANERGAVNLMTGVILRELQWNSDGFSYWHLLHRASLVTLASLWLDKIFCLLKVRIARVCAMKHIRLLPARGDPIMP